MTRNLRRKTIMLLMVVSTAVNTFARALSGTGTQDDPFIIESAQDWQTFADSVNNGKSYSGEYIKLTSDLSDISTMVGTDSCEFQGFFLGDGHTISLNISGTENYIAPFRFVRNAAIYSLSTTGTINADSLLYAAGIVAYADSLFMSACRSSVTIKGNTNRFAFYGGLISYSRSDAMMFNCLFDGKIDAPDASFCSGFIAYVRDSNSAHLYNCLMSGTISCNEWYSGTFSFRENVLDLNSCYYKTAHGRTDGIQTDAQGTELMQLLEFGWQIKNNEVVPVTDVNDIRMSIFPYDIRVYEYTADSIIPEYEFIHLYHNCVEGKQYIVTLLDSLGNTVPAMTDRGRYTLTFTANEQEGLHGSITYPVYVTSLRTDSVGNYLIENSQDWDALAQAVNEFGYDYYNLIKLTNDITVNCPVGTEDNPFSGALDGCGHTINLAIPGNNDAIAPFRSIKDAVITRLNVTGVYNNVQATAIAGFASLVKEELILNSCRSSIVVTNTTKPVATTIYSGMVSASKGKLTFNNCLFDGKLQAPDVMAVNGFVALSTGNCTMNNCLMTGTLECDTLKSGVFFSIAKNRNIILNNCYHNTDFSLDQGIYTSATGNDIKSLLGDGWVVSNDVVIPSIDNKNLTTAVEFYDTGKYYRYTGFPIEFSCYVVTSDYDYIKADTCCDLVIRNSEGQIVDKAIEPGSYTAIFTGTGQYTGGFSFSFSIKDFPEPLEIDKSVTEQDSGFYYVNLLEEDTLTLTLTDTGIKQFKVYDNGGKNNEYAPGCFSYLVMHAPDGFIFKLTGTLLTEGDEDDYYDYVEVYDGNSKDSPCLTGPLYSIDDSIPVNIGTIYSNGPDMLIFFYSDGSIINDGLDFTVSLININNLSLQDIIIEDCPNGKIESDINSARLKDTITLNVRPDSGYHIDSLSVIDRNGNSIYVTGGTWYNNVATFMMPDTAVTVKAHFVSNDSTYFVNMSYNEMGNVSDTIRFINTDILCFKVYDSEGKDRNYLNNTKSSLILFAPQDYRFKLTGTLLTEAFDDDEYDYYDFIKIYDGSTDESPLLAGPLYCDNDTVPVDLDTIYSSGPVIMIYFESDGSITYDGLDFTVTLVPADNDTHVNNPSAIADTPKRYLPDGRLLQGTPTPGTLFLQQGAKVIIIDK